MPNPEQGGKIISRLQSEALRNESREVLIRSGLQQQREVEVAQRRRPPSGSARRAASEWGDAAARASAA